MKSRMIYPLDIDYDIFHDSSVTLEMMASYMYTLGLEKNSKQYNYSVEDTAKLQQLIDSGQFELAEQLQIGLIKQFNNK